MDVAILGIKSLPAAGGADRVVEKILENVSPSNEYWIYMRKDAGGHAHCQDNFHYVHIPALKGKYLGSFSYFFLCCMHYLLKGHYSLAHVHNSDFGLFIALLRLKLGTPVLGTFHGDPYTRAKWGRLARLYLRFSERCFVQFCHRLSSVSRFKSQAMGLWSTKQVAYIPNGVDPYWRESHPESFDFSAMGLEPGRYVLFACGRLDRTKGLHHLLSAWKRHPRDEKLFVVGDFTHDRPYAAEVESTVCDDPSIIVYPELLPRAALLEVVRQCKLFVFPSEYEAMSMMLLEVISCKRPVLCSDIPANRELLVAEYPYLHRSGDTSSLVEKLDAALEDRDPAYWCERLYARCMRDFAWQPIAEAYEKLYREMSRNGVSTAASRVAAKG